ncbi:HET-domain-containing protein [Xylaria palmicola]|nr:HET-domain-containing protein [Xylaria palmicola]
MDYTLPHSCQHCERVLLSRPDDNPDLYQGSEPRQSLLLLKLLRALRGGNKIIGRLAGSFLLEVDPEDMVRFVSDGCLFYRFISTGLEAIGSTHISAMSRTNLEVIERGTNQRQPRHLIIIELKDDAVEISAAYDTPFGNRYLERRPRLLHNCIFGAFPEGAPAAEKFEPVASINISSKPSLARARKWLQDCVQHHPRCSPPAGSSFVPTRLIKIWTHEGRRLIQLRESGGVEVRYVALSYCWGGRQDMQTTKQTIDRYQTEINFNDMPRSIQDAIIVTENLGIQYLWIDAFCIIQDDEEDRQREIDLMGRVYEKADVTIMASRAQGAHEGFLGNVSSYGQTRPDWVFEMHYRDRTGQLSPIVVAPKSFRDPVDHLSKRAWAFQERLFSHRILEYCSTCVHWSCLSHRDCDRQGGKCPPRHLAMKAEMLHMIPGRRQTDSVLWQRLLHTFSEKSLSIHQDRLPAIGGIAERFGLASDDEYLAGIWRSSLPSGLLWTVDWFAVKFTVPTSLEHIMPPRSPSYLAPSWSWASTTLPINSETRGFGVPQVDVIGVNIRNKVAGTTYGAVAYGHLTLRGFVTKATWRLPKRASPHDQGQITKASLILRMFIHRDADETTLQPDETGAIPAYLLVIASDKDGGRVTGLILRKHPDRRYSRLGVFKVPEDREKARTYPLMDQGLCAGDKEVITII